MDKIYILIKFNKKTGLYENGGVTTKREQARLFLKTREKQNLIGNVEEWIPDKDGIGPPEAERIYFSAEDFNL